MRAPPGARGSGPRGSGSEEPLALESLAFRALLPPIRKLWLVNSLLVCLSLESMWRPNVFGRDDRGLLFGPSLESLLHSMSTVAACMYKPIWLWGDHALRETRDTKNKSFQSRSFFFRTNSRARNSYRTSTAGRMAMQHCHRTIDHPPTVGQRQRGGIVMIRR